MIKRIYFKSSEGSNTKMLQWSQLDKRYEASMGKFREIGEAAAYKVAATAKRNVSGLFLKKRTGELANSIDVVEVGSGRTMGIVYRADIGTDVAHGAYHEMGYTIPAMGTPTRNGFNWMRFAYNGRIVYAKWTKAHTEPSRPWLKYAFIEESVNNLRLRFEACFDTVMAMGWARR